MSMESISGKYNQPFARDKKVRVFRIEPDGNKVHLYNGFITGCSPSDLLRVQVDGEWRPRLFQPGNVEVIE